MKKSNPDAYAAMLKDQASRLQEHAFEIDARVEASIDKHNAYEGIHTQGQYERAAWTIATAASRLRCRQQLNPSTIKDVEGYFTRALMGDTAEDQQLSYHIRTEKDDVLGLMEAYGNALEGNLEAVARSRFTSELNTPFLKRLFGKEPPEGPAR